MQGPNGMLCSMCMKPSAQSPPGSACVHRDAPLPVCVNFSCLPACTCMCATTCISRACTACTQPLHSLHAQPRAVMHVGLQSCTWDCSYARGTAVMHVGLQSCTWDCACEDPRRPCAACHPFTWELCRPHT